MRVKICTIAALAAALMLSGCGKAAQADAEPVKRVTIAEVLPQKEDAPPGSHEMSFDQIKVSMPLRWRTANAVRGKAYIDDETHCAYMYCGCASDKWLSPEEILEQYLSKTDGTPSILEKLSEPKQDKNGVSYQTAAVSYKSGGNTDILYFIFSPDNRLFWIFKGETTDPESAPELLAQLTAVADSAEFEIMNTSADLLTGRTVVVSGLDNYVLELLTNNNFLLYTDKNEINDVCTSGTYKIYRGKEAIKYLVGLDEGLTEEGLNDLVKQNCANYDGLYCLVLTVDEVWRYGYQYNSKKYDRAFYGTVRTDGKLNMTDLMQYIELTFTPKE